MMPLLILFKWYFVVWLAVCLTVGVIGGLLERRRKRPMGG